MKCPKCGAQIQEGMHFCQYCGMPLDDVLEKKTVNSSQESVFSHPSGVREHQKKVKLPRPVKLKKTAEKVKSKKKLPIMAGILVIALVIAGVGAYLYTNFAGNEGASERLELARNSAYSYVTKFSESGVAAAREGNQYYFIDQSGKHVNEKSYDYAQWGPELWPIEDELKVYLVRRGTLYGLVDTEGNVIAETGYDMIEPIFDISQYQNRKYRIWIDGLQGLMDQQGNIVCEVYCKTIEYLNSNCNLYAAQKAEGTWELRNEQGVLAEIYAQKARISGEEGSEVAIFDCNGQARIYDASGRVLSDGEYSYDNVEDANVRGISLYSVEQSNGNANFVDYSGHILSNTGYQLVRIRENEIAFELNDQWGIMDYQGNIMTEERYDSISDSFMTQGIFNANGLAVVQEDGKYGIIDKSGTWVNTPVYDFIIESTRGGFEYSLEGLYGFMKENGRVGVDAVSEYSLGIYDNCVTVYRDGKYGVYRRDTYDYLLRNEYDDLQVFPEYGLIKALQGDKGYYFDMEGNQVISDLWVSDISDNGLITVKSTAGYTLYNTKGDSLSYLGEFDEMSKFYEGVAKIRKGTSYGYIDINGNEVIPCIYDAAEDFYHYGVAKVSKDGKWGFVNYAGEQIVDCIYEDLRNYRYGFASMEDGGKWGIMNIEGETMIEPTYDDSVHFLSGEAYVSITTGEDIHYKFVNYLGEVV